MREKGEHVVALEWAHSSSPKNRSSAVFVADQITGKQTRSIPVDCWEDEGDLISPVKCP